MTKILDPRVPASLEAEQSALGGALVDPDSMARIAHLNLAPGHFHHHQHRAIWAAILYLDGQQHPFDIITVFDRLADTGAADGSGGIKYLNELAHSVPSSANIGRYATIVIEKATLRAGLDAVEQARTILLEPDGTPAEKLDRAAALFSPIQQAGLKPDARRLGELIAERIDHWQGLESGDVAAGITTGLPVLDQALGGGLKGGQGHRAGRAPRSRQDELGDPGCSRMRPERRLRADSFAGDDRRRSR